MSALAWTQLQLRTAEAMTSIPMNNAFVEENLIKHNGVTLNASRIYVTDEQTIVASKHPDHTSVFPAHLEHMVDTCYTVVDLTQYAPIWLDRVDQVIKHFQKWYPDFQYSAKRTLIRVCQFWTETVHEIELQTKAGTKKTTLTRIHVTCWPDSGVIPVEILHALCQRIEKEVRILIHCMKGMGRTGTAITAYSLYRNPFSRLQMCDLNEIILHYRKQRSEYIVHTHGQYLLLFEYNRFLMQ